MKIKKEFGDCVNTETHHSHPEAKPESRKPKLLRRSALKLAASAGFSALGLTACGKIATFGLLGSAATTTPEATSTPATTATLELVPTDTPAPTIEPTIEPEKLTRVMLLGDSITEMGLADYLYATLEQSGYKCEFLGSNLSKKKVRNEGHGGYTTAGILRDLKDGFWSSGAKAKPVNLDENTPDILIIHLGTCDAASGFSPEGVTIPDINKIILIFRENNPNLKVVVLPVIPAAYEWDRTIQKTNYHFWGMVRELSKENSPVVLAPDVRTNFYRSRDLIDGIHPTESGYGIMVESLMVALESNVFLVPDAAEVEET